MNRYGMLALVAATMEQAGFPKREILVGRVESARDSQQDAREEITDALTAFGRIVAYEGGGRAFPDPRRRERRGNARAIAEADRLIVDLWKDGG